MTRSVQNLEASQDSSDELTDGFAVMEMNDINVSDGIDEWLVTVILGSKAATFKVDTGAQCNAMSEKYFTSLNIPNLVTRHTSTILKTFNKTRVVPLYKVVVPCCYDNTCKMIEIFIVKEDVPAVLGLATCVKLNLIKKMYSVDDGVKKTQGIEDKYSDVFEGLGMIEGVVHKIQIDSSVPPVIHAPRNLSAALRQPLKSELDRLELLGVIKKVTEPTDWVNSLVIVPKKDGTLRLCLDPKDLNCAIKREHYPMQTVEDIMTRMPNAKFMTVLDANHGFWQIQLDEESSKLCTFNTCFGRYRFNRLPFGIKSAPEVFTRTVRQLFENLEGVEVVVDDILVWGSTLQEHDKRLEEVLKQVRRSNLKLNKDKCKFRQSEVTYLGHLLTSKGMKPDPSKVNAVTEMPIPTNAKELQRFLGMVTYLSKFIPNVSQIAAPLRKILEKDVLWHWGKHQAESFNKLKFALSHAPCLAYFDVDKPLTLSVDASSKALGACILQDGRPIAYASKALTTSEQNYAQIEKEMYAIVFGCERFHDFLYGHADISVQTDHKPLEIILKKPVHAAPMRLQRMILRLFPYQLNVKYKAGSELYIADTLSRTNNLTQDTDETETEEYMINLISEGTFSDSFMEQLVHETKKDAVMQLLRRTILIGWPEKRSQAPKEIQVFWNYRDEISTCNDLLLKGIRIIIPSSLKSNVLERLHYAHFGIEKTRARARESCFWPNMAADIEDYVSRCKICLKHQRSNQKEPLLPHEIPDTPWSAVAADIFYHSGKDYLLVVDYYSKYVEIAKLQSKTSDSVVYAMKEMFARHGIPENIVADNMPFNSMMFKDFCRNWEIGLKTSSPRYPKSNGLAERNIQTVKRLLVKSVESNQDIHPALLELRNTPIADMPYSPAELLMSRKLRSKLPLSKPQLKPRLANNAYGLLQHRQAKQKEFYDRNAKSLKPLHPNDVVRVQRVGEWHPGVVAKQHASPRSYIVTTPDGSVLRRNRSHLMATKDDHPDYIGPALLDEPPGSNEDEEASEELIPRRSNRVRRRPNRLIESC